MTRLLVDNEHDMEYGITYITKLIKEKGNTPQVEITFPSELLANMFVENLLNNFRDNEVPRDIQLDLKLCLPEED